ncbi:MAG: ParB/RepB/Spo0J family partition protein [Bacteroidia bacterium]|nr:ParB/RepB/Spo0J family partition protein [Bacteroidia bacterium]
MSSRKNALGRGLSALLENEETDITSHSEDISGTAQVGIISKLPISQIETNPFQPRDHFDEKTLQELSESIAEHDLIQPITVRKLGYDQYQIISGERRYRASKLADLKEIPTYIRIANDQQMLEMALVENLQRENLNAIEISISFQRLIEECSLTQEELGGRVGKNRSTVTNYLRLLKLPPEIQMGLRDMVISMGHARAIISMEDSEIQLAIYKEIVDKNLSVRQVEQLSKSYQKSTSGKRSKAKLSPQLNDIQNDLTSYFETKVNLKQKSNGKGNIVIEYFSDSDLNRILEILGRI